MESVIVGEPQRTGINSINIDLVISKWNHLWWLSEWKLNNSWRLISHVRQDSPITKINLSISHNQAQELIKKLAMVSEQSSSFKSGVSWRRQEDIDYREEYRAKKYHN